MNKNVATKKKITANYQILRCWNFEFCTFVFYHRFDKWANFERNLTLNQNQQMRNEHIYFFRHCFHGFLLHSFAFVYRLLCVSLKNDSIFKDMSVTKFFTSRLTVFYLIKFYSILNFVCLRKQIKIFLRKVHILFIQ